MSETLTVEESSPEVQVKVPAKKKEPKAPVVLTNDGMVIYTDAGAKPNPGFAGWGFHGYVYSDEVAKKGSGNTAVYLTAKGYQAKHPADGANVEKPKEVTPLRYIDGLGAIPPCSNNAAEVVAMSEGLRHAVLQGVKRVNLLADSQHAIDGAMKWVGDWRDNHWIKKDGTPVKNLSYWKGLADALDAIKAAGIELKVGWVKAHNGDVGNTKADQYATMGVTASRHGVMHGCITTTPPEGYWNAKKENHPLLSLKYAYFVSNPISNVPGDYYLGDHGKDHSTAGKRDADTGYAFVRLNEPDHMLEAVRQYVLEVAEGSDTLVMAHMGTLYNSTLIREYELMNRFSFVRKGHRLDMMTVRKEPIIEEFIPHKLAGRAIEAVNELKGVLDDWSSAKCSDILVSTDITDYFFDTDAKKGKQLSKKFLPGCARISVTANYADKGVQEPIELELFMGVDLPDRNKLKNIEALDPAISVVTWRQGQAVRFAVIVKVKDAVGIWAGYYANLKLVK